jgi:hypothetical protein
MVQSSTWPPALQPSYLVTVVSAPGSFESRSSEGDLVSAVGAHPSSATQSSTLVVAPGYLLAPIEPPS